MMHRYAYDTLAVQRSAIIRGSHPRPTHMLEMIGEESLVDMFRTIIDYVQENREFTTIFRNSSLRNLMITANRIAKIFLRRYGSLDLLGLGQADELFLYLAQQQLSIEPAQQVLIHQQQPDIVVRQQQQAQQSHVQQQQQPNIIVRQQEGIHITGGQGNQAIFPKSPEAKRPDDSYKNKYEAAKKEREEQEYKHKYEEELRKTDEEDFKHRHEEEKKKEREQHEVFRRRFELEQRKKQEEEEYKRKYEEELRMREDDEFQRRHEEERRKERELEEAVRRRVVEEQRREREEEDRFKRRLEEEQKRGEEGSFKRKYEEMMKKKHQLEKEKDIKRTHDEDTYHLRALEPTTHTVQTTKTNRASDTDTDSSSAASHPFDPYSALGLPDRSLTPEDIIKTTYNNLAMILHPDRQTGKTPQQKKRAAKRMCEINRAKEILLDAERRKAFDEVGAVYLHEVGEWKREKSKGWMKVRSRGVESADGDVGGGFGGARPPSPGGNGGERGKGGKGKGKYVPP